MPEDQAVGIQPGTILQALGVLDPDGKTTARLRWFKAADVRD